MSSPAIVIISSSPPRAFAGSPTSAESPSPLKSPSTPIRDGAKRFKSSGQTRDRFSGGFSSARALLTMSGAENIPLRSPGPPRFRSQSSKQSRDDVGSPVPVAKFVKKKTNATAEQLSDHFKPSKSSMPSAAPSLNVALEGPCCYDEDAYQQLSSPRQTETLERSRHRSPHPLNKAVPRRLDWTPVKSSEDVFDTPGSGKQPAGALSNLMSSYAFTSTTNVSNKVTTKFSTSGEQLKRKRIDLVMTTEATPASFISKTLTIKETKRASKVKAPSKKALTITGLATSAYRNEQERGGRLLPMVEYLAAIQTADGGDSESVIDVSLKKRSKAKIPSKKARGTTKASTKSRLVSPTSAMKTTLEQPFLFGPASQLVRDEAPTLIRDTSEALKKSEEIFSDPFSPQWTQPFSIESNSPRAAHGTGRLVKKRNLWGAAGRDADNALLQVETVDMTDSPAVRQALAGKDALLQLRSPKHERTVSVVDGHIRVSTTQTPHIKSAGSVIDIYDFDTPGLPRQPMISKKPPVRAMHTLRPLEALQEKIEIQDQAVEAASQPKDSSPNPIPAMPSYEGWADHALKKQIAAFGFKPVKKRDKMVELLQRCWESKHSIKHNSDQEEELENALTHGDFLTKVHDVSARPTPKIKKPRAKRKSDSGDPATPKEPKTRKKAPAKSAVSHKEKAPRKRASKKKLLSDEKVLDIDDIEDHIKQATSIHSGPAETSNKAEQRQKKPNSATILQERPATPPPTIPQLDFTSSSPAFEDLRQPRAEATINVNGGEVPNPVLTPEQTPIVDIMIQIQAAINHRPQTEGATYGPRNHQISPTWREKILMYDPIVLEELTAWLNTEGFQAIGEDREVGPLQVRDWCEQNGVCCHGVWGGWRGRGEPGEGE